MIYYEYELEKDITNCIPINKNRDLYVLETSYRKIQHPVHKRSMAKPYYALHLVIKGSGTLIAPEGRYRLKEGDIFIRFPQENIQYFDDETDPWSYIFITFMGNHAEEYFSRLGYSPQKRIFPTDENLTRLFVESVILPQKYRAGMDIIANSYIAAIFSRLAIIYCSEYPSNPNNIDNYINKAFDYIEAHVSDSNMHAEDVAHYLGLNPDYFLRIFKKDKDGIFQISHHQANEQRSSADAQGRNQHFCHLRYGRLQLHILFHQLFQTVLRHSPQRIHTQASQINCQTLFL